MRLILRRCVSVGGAAVCAVAVLLALLLGVSRAALPILGEYRQEIQAQLSEFLGRDISIGKIDAGWHGTTPQVELVDVSIDDASGSRTEFRVDSIFLSLDMVNTLRSGALRVKEIGLRGCDIGIVRNADHTIAIHGLELGVPSLWDSALLGSIEPFAQSRVSLVDCRVGWKDAISGKNYRFEGVNASVSAEDRSKRIAVRLTPANNLGRELTMLMEFQGRLNRPSGWRGRLYIDAQDLRLDAFLPPRILHEYGLEGGRLKIENWSEWQQGKPIRMQGSFSLSEVQFSSPSVPAKLERASAHDIDLIRSRFEWHSTASGWQLRVGGIKTIMQGRSWPESGFNLEYRVDDDARRRFRGAFVTVNLEQMSRLLALLPGSLQVLSPAWKRLALAGELSDARFSLSLDAEGVERYRIGTRFRDVGMSPRKKMPGFAGLDGWIDISDRGGEVVVESRNVLLDYPQVFVNTLSADYLSAVATWYSEDGRLHIDSKSLRIGNEDIEVAGEGGFVFGQGSPYLNFKLSYAHGNGANLERYLPKAIMPQRVYQWLERSISDVYIASGSAIIRGRASEFPFVAGDGLFEASAELESGILDYRPGWPELDEIQASVVFRGQSMMITNARAGVLDSRLSGVTVTIDNLRRAELEMQADIRGPLADVWRYSSQTILPSDDRRIVRDLRLEGLSHMKLIIDLPLSKLIKDRGTVRGELFLKEAVLQMQHPNLKLENITGKLTFSPRGAQGQGIHATLRGRPVLISARPVAFAATVFEVQGRFGAGHLVQNLGVEAFQEALDRSLQGTSKWLAEVIIPHSRLRGDNRKLEFKIWSNLHGIEITAPEPFKKAAAEQEAFFLNAQLEPDGTLPLRMRYGKHLSMALSLQKKGDDYALEGAEVRLYRGKAVMTRAPGIKILGALPRLSIDAWRSWADTTLDVGQWRGIVPGNKHMPLAIDIDFHRLVLFGQVFEDLALNAERQLESWRLRLDSPVVKGYVIVPETFASGAPIRANLEYLELPQRSLQPRSINIDPHRIPALEIKSKSLRYGDLTFDRLYLDTSAHRHGMRIDDLLLDAEDFSLRLSGQWIATWHQAHHTRLQLVINSDDFGAMMHRLNLETGFESGLARVKAELQFPAAPFQWGYEGLSGKAHIELKQGRFGEFEPGPWRVLGLMNIDALSRRLALNFSDLVKKGFSYDKIEGNLDIEGSNVYTSDLSINGPSADLAITGRMGFEARDYDQILSVTSKVSTGISVAGALLGGIGVGAAIFVADRIINSMGGSIDNVTRLDYKVTGSWDEPEIELISPSTTDDSYNAILEDDVG